MLYWVIHKECNAVIFRFKKTIFSITAFFNNKRLTSAFSKRIIRTLLQQIITNGIIALLLYISDAFVSTEFSLTINNALLNDILIGGMSIAGIILGLYCSNVTSIYSARYVNAPNSLSEMFQNDIVTNKCIKRIIGYIILSLILLSENLLGVNIYICSVAVIFILTVRMIITFSLTGNRTYQLSDTYKIANSIYPEIYSLFMKASKRSYLSSDISFQNHYQKICFKKIDILSDIAKYNQDNPSNQNAAMLEFVYRNIRCISYYWSLKKSIYYNSLWFQNKVQYPQWHLASDESIQVALQTGAPLNVTYTKNYEWLEETFEKTNNICIEKLCNEKNLNSIYSYLSSISELAYWAAKGNSTQQFVIYLKSLQDKILPLSVQMCNDDEESNSEAVAAIVDIYIVAYLNIIVGLNKYLSSINPKTELENAKNYLSYKAVCFDTNEFLNDVTVEKMYQCIEAEINIEHTRITPDWVIEQTVAKVIFDRMNIFISTIDKVYNDVIVKMGAYLFDHKLHFAAMIVFSKIPEFNSKINLMVEHLEPMISFLQSKHLEPKIIWNRNLLPDFIERKEKTTNSIPGYWIKCTGIFAVKHWENRENYPDLLGFCYNNLCEYLISAIENNNFEKYKSAYVNFLGIMLLYQEYIRNDVAKRKEEYIQNALFHVFTAPMLEYAMISGLAIIWGEFSNCSSWQELVQNTLKDFFESDSIKGISVLENWVKLLTMRKNSFIGIGNRDLLQTNWEQRISSAIRNNGYYRFEYAKYGIKIIKTESSLLKALCKTSFDLMGLEHTEDVYLIMCINRYLTSDKKYTSQYGWEDNLDNERKD